MSIMYKSTRSNSDKVTASQAILKGLADDGDYLCRIRFLHLKYRLKNLADMTYQETAYEVMKLFLSDFTEEELKHVLMVPMMINSTPRKLLRLLKKMALIIWNCSMERQSPLKIWHFRSAIFDDNGSKEKWC